MASGEVAVDRESFQMVLIILLPFVSLLINLWKHDLHCIIVMPNDFRMVAQ